MKPFNKIAIMLLLVLSGTSHAAEQGVMRAISIDAKQITIDEGRYLVSPQLRINNLGSGLNSLNYAKIGQPVRFTLTSQGEISELWLYPLRADERQSMGIRLGEEQQ